MEGADCMGKRSVFWDDGGISPSLHFLSGPALHTDVRTKCTEYLLNDIQTCATFQDLYHWILFLRARGTRKQIIGKLLLISLSYRMESSPLSFSSNQICLGEEIRVRTIVFFILLLVCTLRACFIYFLHSVCPLFVSDHPFKISYLNSMRYPFGHLVGLCPGSPLEYVVLQEGLQTSYGCVPFYWPPWALCVSSFCLPESAHTPFS